VEGSLFSSKKGKEGRVGLLPQRETFLFFYSLGKGGGGGEILMGGDTLAKKIAAKYS